MNVIEDSKIIFTNKSSYHDFIKWEKTAERVKAASSA